MSTTLTALKSVIIRQLEDTLDESGDRIGGSEYPFEVLEDAIRAALKAITSRYWKRAVLNVDADETSAELPEALIDVDGVFETALGIFLPRVSFQVGNALAATEGNGWYLYPSGTISFINKVGTSGAKVYYQSHWAMPAQDDQALEIPDLAITCITYYASAYLLASSAVSSASIRQFNTRVDSGQPGDIPQMKMSNFLMAKYEEELKRIPLMEKGRVQ